MDYFVWYDESLKKTAADKIQEAIAAYVVRFAAEPNLVLVNSHDQTEVRGVLVRSEPMIQRNTFWLGLPEKNVK